MRRGSISGAAALGLAAIAVLASACTATAQDSADPSAAIAYLVTATAPAPGPSTPKTAGDTDRTPGQPTLDEPLRGPGHPAADDHRPSTAPAGARLSHWSPEAARAGQVRAGAGIPSPEGERGASVPIAPPETVEVLPGPSEPHGRASEWAAPAGPVRLVSSRQGKDPPTDVAAAILGAYAAFWDSYWAAATHPVNPEHPGIGRHSVEPLRSRTVGVLLGRAVEGVALRLPGDHGAGRVVHIEGWGIDSAEVLDCFVDTAVLYEVSTGRVRNDERATVVHLALLRRQEGDWRVAEIFEQAIHTGRTDGCTMHADSPTTPAPGAGGTVTAGAPLLPW
ncbi:MAG: hypothetical protein OXI26_07750 [bacterium]|nr:hypothetical protein [bacterium]